MQATSPPPVSTDIGDNLVPDTGSLRIVFDFESMVFWSNPDCPPTKRQKKRTPKGESYAQSLNNGYEEPGDTPRSKSKFTSVNAPNVDNGYKQLDKPLTSVDGTVLWFMGVPLERSSMPIDTHWRLKYVGYHEMGIRGRIKRVVKVRISKTGDADLDSQIELGCGYILYLYSHNKPITDQVIGSLRLHKTVIEMFQTWFKKKKKNN